MKIREQGGDNDLIEDTIELYDKVRDGDYEGYWGWDSEYHAERMMCDNSWVEEAADLFLRTESACRKGQYEIALKAYEMLFDILNNEELPCYGDYESMMDINLDEQKNSFLMCIYFTNNLERRSILILNAIDKMGYGYRNKFRLSNIIDSCSEPLPEFREFVKLFAKNLIDKDELLYKELLFDTVFIDGGIEAIKEFARKNYEKYPEAYLFFTIKFAEKEIVSDKIIDICKEALLKISREYN